MFKKRGQVKEYQGFFARNKLAIAVTTLMGTIVGAGILGLPYVIALSGFAVGVFLIVFLGLAFLLLNLFTGEIILRTKEPHQLTGYVGKYLGKWGKCLMTFSMVVSIYGALTAYLIGEGEAFKSIFTFGSSWMYALVFFIIATFIVYRGIKATGKAELILISIMILVVVLLGIFSFDRIDYDNLATFNLTYLFVPYGVILFSFMGLAAIPEIREELTREKKKIKAAIIIGSLLPILIYILFTVVVMGIISLNQFESLLPNQKIATIALSFYTNPFLGKFVNVLAVLTMFTSFLALGIALMGIYEYDYFFSKRKAFLLTFSIPLLIFLFKFTTFISLISFVGALAGGLDGILIVLTYWKVKKLGDRKPEYSLNIPKIFGLLIIILFIAGIIYQIFLR